MKREITERTRDRFLTPEEAVKYQTIREQVEREKPGIAARIKAQLDAMVGERRTGKKLGTVESASMTNSAIFAALTAFLDRLEQANIYYELAYNRPGAVMVQIAVPGERWEIEFMSDGAIEIEKFKSDGTILDGTELDKLFARFAD